MHGPLSRARPRGAGFAGPDPGSDFDEDHKPQRTITAIEHGAVNSTVRTDPGGAVITSMITNDAVAELGLAEDKTAYAIVRPRT